MAYNNKYGSYRGRKQGGRTVIALVLVVVIVLSLGYLIWGNHGLSWSSFPRFAPEEVVVETTELPEVELIIDKPQSMSTGAVRSGLLLDTDATRWNLEEVADFDMVALVAKDGTGKLYYPSTASGVVYGALASTATSNGPYITEVLSGETHTIAMMSVLEDPLYTAYYVTGAALMKNTGYAYKDENNMAWLDPAKEDAQQWILSVVDELIAMGFDELMLTEFHYPQTGDLETIRYSAEDPAQALEDLLVAIWERTQEAGVSLGVEMSPGALVSGTVPYEDWTDYVDTFYAATNDLPTAQSLVGDDVVTLCEQVPISGSYLLTP